MVAVARAMSGNVKLLLLDEPFEGLAPAVILELFRVFDQLRRHTSIVIVEHNLDLVLALADRVFALERGAVFHQGPAAPLLTDLEYRKKICGCSSPSLRAKRSNPSGGKASVDCFVATLLAMTWLVFRLILVRPVARDDFRGALVEQLQADRAAEFAGADRRAAP